jgi:excisionase family DNA binding protein
MTENTPLLETPAQAAARAGISSRQVRGLIAAGKLAHVRIGRRIMIPVGALEKAIEAEMVKPWRDEIKAHDCVGSQRELVTTSVGPNAAVAASTARARRIAKKLKLS